MARYQFGGIADYVVSLGDVNQAVLETGVSVSFWNAATGGTQYTDLMEVDGVSPIAGGAVTSNAVGAIPEFLGPDGVTEMYVDASGGAGPRRKTGSTGLGTLVSGLDTEVSVHTGSTDNPHQVTAAQTGAMALTDAGSWFPGDAGFRAWSFDPVSAAVTMNCAPGQLYLTAVNVRAVADLNNVSVYTTAAGTTPLNGQSYVGIYDDTGALVAQTAALNGVWAPGFHNTAVIPLTAEYFAEPGVYWVGILINGPAVAADGPTISAGSRVGVASVWGPKRHARLAGPYTALPASITPGSLTPDDVAMWVAVS